MKVPRTLIGLLFANVTDTKGLFKAIQAVWEKMAAAINGRISFGDGNHLQPDNIDGVWVSVVTPGVANTDFTVTHNLNRLPSGYWAMQKSAATDIYTGSVSSTKTQITLRATATGVTVLLFIV